MNPSNGPTPTDPSDEETKNMSDEESRIAALENQDGNPVTRAKTKDQRNNTEYSLANSVETTFSGLGSNPRYADVAPLYGNYNLIPVPANSKQINIAGVTGKSGRAITAADRAKWANRAGNYALRVDKDIVGIDIDDYMWVEDGELKEKVGSATVEALEKTLGVELPPTVFSTGRSPEEAAGRKPSGIHFYRLPAGFEANLSSLGDDVEVIRWGHRYAVVAPSTVTDEKGERVYRWYSADKVPLDQVPGREDMAELPLEWADFIGSKAKAAGPEGRVPDLTLEDVDPDYARTKVNAVLASVRSSLEETVLLPEGVANSHGNTWEKEVADAARNVWRAVLTPHSGMYDQPELGWVKLCELVPDEMQADGLSYTLRAKWDAEEKSTRRDKGPLMVLTREQLAIRDLTGVTVPPVDQADLTGDPEKDEIPTRVAQFDYTTQDPVTLAEAILKFSEQEWRFAEDENGWYERDAKTGLWRAASQSTEWCSQKLVQIAGASMPMGDPFAEKGTELEAVARKRLNLIDGRKIGALGKHVSFVAKDHAFRVGDAENPNRVWVPGYCYDLRTGKLAEGMDPRTPHMRQTGAAPRAGEYPRFQAFLDTVLPDQEEQQFLWALMGETLTGHSGRTLVYLYGTRGSGKSTMLRLMQLLMGSYTGKLEQSMLDGKATPSQMVDIIGARLLTKDEQRGNGFARVSWEGLKNFIGGDGLIQGSRKFKSTVQGRAAYTVWVASNDEPTIADDDALKDRVKPLKFITDQEAVVDVVAPVLRRDGGEGWLQEEGPAVMAKVVWAATQVLGPDSAEFTRMPESIRQERDRIALEQDDVARWMTECTVQEGETPVKELYGHFRSWVTDQGFQARNAQSFGMRLTALGIANRKSNGEYMRPLVLAAHIRAMYE